MRKHRWVGGDAARVTPSAMKHRSILPTKKEEAAIDAGIAAGDEVCFSGGARGADLAWGALARRLKHRVMHFSFAGHRTKAPRAERVILSPAQLREADPHLIAASHALHRAWPPRTDYAAQLLQRDWHQVKDSERVYAVASLDADGQIAGGTAWAVAMFIARHAGDACEAFLYDQNDQQWLHWQGAWQAIAAPPQPHGRWTGIGARDLNAAGAAAIAYYGEAERLR